MAEVVFDNVRKNFGSTVAVDALDLTIDEGEFVSLLGPSGCGKTTTLRMLAGLEEPSGGTIRIGDRVVNSVPPAQRDIAMVFQSYALYPHMTVAKNMAYPLKKRGVREPERSERVMATARLLELETLLDRKPAQLSGGQQQRVALGRAMVREPQVFLLDEPLSNLDARLRAHMRAELIEVHRRIGRTMIYVTHDQLEAMTMSTRIAVMNAGVLQQFATPADIFHRPANVFVAGFIGSPAMSLLDGELVVGSDGDGEFRVHCGALDVTLPAGLLDRSAALGPISLGIRPEDILLGSGDHTGVVGVVERTGHESIVRLDAQGTPLIVRAPGDTSIESGETVRFSLRVERIHLFSSTTGLRLNADGEGS
jgi:multiple sugar transport system ATP-binding protein